MVMTSVSEDTPKKLKSKKADPTRFLPPGQYYRGKFIGIEHVADACGDRSDMMCQVAMAKMKAAIKTLGDHKRKIIINISINGIKILDEKDEEVMFDHPLSRISYISRDISDSRAFGYVFNPGHDFHEFYGIKTEKAAEVVVSSLSDLFRFVFSQTNPSLPEDSSQYDESRRMPSPPYITKYGGIGEGGTLGRFRKSPRLLYRFYNTVANAPAVNTSSPRKQAGFLTLCNRQSSVPTHTQAMTSPIISTAHEASSSSVPPKTPSLSSSSSSNQNVTNSPSALAMKSPMSVVASKKSLSSISSLPVIESPPPNSPTAFKPPGSSSQTSLKTNVGPSGDGDDDDDHNNSDIKTSNRVKTNTSGDNKLREHANVVIEEAALDSSESTQVVEVLDSVDATNQSSWANFDEFEFSDAESQAETGGASREDSTPVEKVESDFNHKILEGKISSSSTSREPRVSAFRASHLFLSFNGIDPFIDDPFFSKNVDVSFDSFKIDDSSFSDFELVLPQWEDLGSCKEVHAEVEDPIRQDSCKDITFAGVSSQSGTFEFQENETCNNKFFEDDFMPKLSSLDREESSLGEPGELSRPQAMNGDDFEEDSSNKLTTDKPEVKAESRCIQVLPEIPRNLLLPSISLKSMLALKSSIAFDSSPTSPSTNPSEFPSPDIPPPPLPPEASTFSPLPPIPPPLPPRRPHWQKVCNETNKDEPTASSTEEDIAPIVLSFAQSSQVRRDEIEGPSRTKKLDTASILKLYSVPATSYFSLLNSAASGSTADDEPTYGNLHSVLTDVNSNLNPNDGSPPCQTLTSSTFSTVPPPGVPERKLSPAYLSFQSFPLTGCSPVPDPIPRKDVNTWTGL